MEQDKLIQLMEDVRDAADAENKAYDKCVKKRIKRNKSEWQEQLDKLTQKQIDLYQYVQSLKTIDFSLFDCKYDEKKFIDFLYKKYNIVNNVARFIWQKIKEPL